MTTRVLGIVGTDIVSESICTFAYRVVEGDQIDAVRRLWEKLRAHHSPLLVGFPGAMPPFNFEPRKQELLNKAAAIRIELVCATPDGLEIAYCISTVSRDNLGEIDSMFVEEAFRGRGIGSELVRHALKWLGSAGATSKVVTVAHENKEALAFYKRFGFEPRTVLMQQSEAGKGIG
jgi:ribosomal protein S18 acetylase RimI-like enzyme